MKTWWKDGRKYEAPLEPFKLYYVSPNNIYYTDSKIGATFECSIEDGDWDKDIIEFNKNDYFRAFHEHFINGIKWEETLLYERNLENLGNGKKFSSEQEIIEKLRGYDELYARMDKSGYMTQKELKKKNKFIENLDKYTLTYYPPEMDEVTVDVGRDGELIWYSGQSRVSIAKLLDIDKIPVRVRIRHKNWQKKRDEVWTSTNNELENRAHPDIRPLIKK